MGCARATCTGLVLLHVLCIRKCPRQSSRLSVWLPRRHRAPSGTCWKSPTQRATPLPVGPKLGIQHRPAARVKQIGLANRCKTSTGLVLKSRLLKLRTVISACPAGPGTGGGRTSNHFHSLFIAAGCHSVMCVPMSSHPSDWRDVHRSSTSRMLTVLTESLYSSTRPMVANPT